MRGYKGGTRGLLRRLGRLLRKGDCGDPAAFNAELRRIAENLECIVLPDEAVSVRELADRARRT